MATYIWLQTWVQLGPHEKKKIHENLHAFGCPLLNFPIPMNTYMQKIYARKEGNDNLALVTNVEGTQSNLQPYPPSLWSVLFEIAPNFAYKSKICE